MTQDIPTIGLSCTHAFLSMLEAKKYALGSLSTFESWLIYLGAGLSLIVIGFLLTRNGATGRRQSLGRNLKGIGTLIFIMFGIVGAIFSLISGALH
jgi:hypothetical protein